MSSSIIKKNQPAISISNSSRRVEISSSFFMDDMTAKNLVMIEQARINGDLLVEEARKQGAIQLEEVKRQGAIQLEEIKGKNEARVQSIKSAPMRTLALTVALIVPSSVAALLLISGYTLITSSSVTIQLATLALLAVVFGAGFWSIKSVLPALLKKLISLL